MAPVVPLEPFETWPVHLHDSELQTFAWYARPATFVTQTTGPRATVGHTKLIADAMDHLLATRKHEVEMHAGLMIIHDWRSIREIDPEARRFYSQRVERYNKGDQRAAYIALDMNPAMRSIVRLGATALPFRVGYTVEIVDDPLYLIGRHSLIPVGGANPFGTLALGRI